MKNTIGVYGLGVMGRSLAYNIAKHNYNIAVYDKDDYIVDDFRNRFELGNNVETYYELTEFIDSLEKPRKVLIMVTAGQVVDLVLNQLLQLLEANDIVIDCGNSFYKDTIRRQQYCMEKEILFYGVGVSGGEAGALNGPSIMPSGDKDNYHYIEEILNDISAKCKDGTHCCTYIGPSGAGHYVKMVHNGIEYGDMQIICECYQFMRSVLHMEIDEIQKVFEKWNEGKLHSYLIEITSKILKVKDDKTGQYLVDVILDKAGQKGTGLWTSIEGLELKTPIPSLVESVFARCLSAKKDERVIASKILLEKASKDYNKNEILNDLENALYCAKIICYAQGFSLLKQASKANDWNLNFGSIAMIWREGCIIKARFLEEIKSAYDDEPNCTNLLLNSRFSEILNDNVSSLRKCVIAAIENGVYIPTLSTSLEYYDGYRSEVLPFNLLQGMRDFFGAHTYQRIDDLEENKYHTEWEKYL